MEPITYPIEFAQSKFLVLSSLLLLYPMLNSYNTGQHFLMCVSGSAGVASINHWRRAEDGMRRKIDVICARTSFAIYFVNGLIFIESFSRAMPFLIMCYVFYTFSSLFAQKGYKKWVICHALFHYTVMVMQQMVITSKSNSTMN
jgi:hypothetical protein